MLSYWTSAPEVRGLGRMVARIARVEALECDSAHEAAWLERSLLERSRPWWNRTAGGQETPTGIALVGGSRRPGLYLLHEHELADGAGGPRAGSELHRFGPYLGGNQVRAAIDGLLRVAPLDLAGDRLSGSERAMAAALGVAPADRERLLALVLGALSREPRSVAGVTGELERRRDAAAERLDFETAAVLQDALVGVRWVTAPVRVLGVDPGDATFAAGGDGLLVQLGVHGGRVDAWTARPASPATIVRAIRATPDAWRPWLDRAAALAARLAATP